MKKSKYKKLALLILRLLLKAVASFLLLFLLVLITLQFSVVQTFLTSRIAEFVTQKTGTRLEVEKVSIRFPKKLGLKGVYAGDLQDDTLAYVGSLHLDINLIGLLRKQILINTLELENAKAFIYRADPDTTFNFDFFIQAFAPADTSATSAPAQKEQKPWKFRVKKVQLQDIQFQMKDHLTGTDLKLILERLTTRLDDSDLLDSRYHLGHTRIQGLDIAIHMSDPSVSLDKENEGLPDLDIHLNSLVLEDSHFLLHNQEGLDLKLALKKLNLVPRQLHLKEQSIHIEALTLEQPELSISLPVINEPIEAIVQDSLAHAFAFRMADAFTWDMQLKHFQLQSGFFSLKHKGQPLQTQYFDAQSFKLENVNIKIQDIHLSPQHVALDLQKTEALISRTFSIKELSLQIQAGPHTHLKNLKLRTAQSQINLDINTSVNLLDFSLRDLQHHRMKLVLGQNHIQNDLAWIIPAMNAYYFQWPGNKGLRFGGHLHGRFDDLQADSLWLTAPGFFTTHMDGRIQNLSTPDEIAGRLDQFILLAAPARFFSYLPDSLKPQGVQLPEYLHLQARARGSQQAFDLLASLQSNLGNIQVKANLKDSLPHIHQLQALIQARGIKTGIILQNELFQGNQNLDFTVEGNIKDRSHPELRYQLTLAGLNLRNYSYDDLNVKGNVKDSLLFAQMHYTDDSLALKLESHYTLGAQIPSLKANLRVEYANLSALGLTEPKIGAAFNLLADLKLFPADFFSGELLLSDARIATPEKVYHLPRFSIISKSDTDNYILHLQSTFLNAIYQGNVSPISTPAELTRYFARYFAGDPYDTLVDPATDKHFILSASLLPDDILNEVLIPELHSFKPLSLEVHYSNQSHRLYMDLDLPQLQFQDIDLNQLHLAIRSNSSQMEFALSSKSLDWTHFKLRDLRLDGTIANNLLAFGLQLSDENHQALYALEGTLQAAQNAYKLQLKPDKLLINRQKWSVPDNNLLVFGKDTLWFDQFILQNQISGIHAQSTINEGSAIHDFTFNQLSLGDFTDITGSNEPLLSGQLNGNLKLLSIREALAFVADLSIADLAYMGDTLGHFSLKAENPQPDLYRIHARLKTTGTSITATGNYRNTDPPDMQIDLHMGSLHLPAFEHLAQGILTDLSGNVFGRVQISGPPQNPLLRGKLNFESAAFRAPQLGNRFLLRNESLSFDRQNIVLQNFALEDSLGRRTILNGQLNIADFRNIGLNLDVSARNFLLMRVHPGQNNLYHGQILMDSELRLRGSQSAPSLEGRIKLNPGSAFTLILPQSTPEAIGNEGIVEFINPADTILLARMMSIPAPHGMTTSYQNLDLSLNIEIDPQTDVKIIIDEMAGDFLALQGGGVLSLGIDPGGRMTLSGRYEIQDGEYLLSFYDVITRQFKIQRGSHIVWSGDPLNADVNITAIFNVRTQARDLLLAQSNQNQAQLRQQFPFLLSMKMSGKLMKPDITFEVNLPPEHQNALDGQLQAKLTEINQNESELNKQVFALLMLGHFIQENPFASLGGTSLTATARSSVSQILSSQLNRMSDRYIKGLDINIEIESYEDFSNGQTGGRTELQLEVSKNLFDERLRVKVGGNIELEDETQRQRNPGDIAGDFMLEYLIRPDGSLILKGFRKKDYRSLFDQQVIETGVSLLFTRSYNRFRDLFIRKEEEPVPLPASPPDDNVQLWQTHQPPIKDP